MSYSSLGAQVWHVLTRDHTVLPATHAHVYPQVESTVPAFKPQPQSVAALWLVLVSRPGEGRRLSWRGWLGEKLGRFGRPKTVTRSSICRGGRELNARPSSRKSNAIISRHLVYAGYKILSTIVLHS